MNTENTSKDIDPTESANESSGTQSNDKSFLSSIVEDMMNEMEISNFDHRSSHMLVDLLQREALVLLKTSAENSEKRLSTEKEKLLCGNSSTTTLTKPNMKVNEEDAQIACQEYINDKVANPGVLRDILELQKYANNVRIAAKAYSTGGRQKSFSSYRGEEELGQFPTGSIPYLPENISLNTLLPHWDIGLKEKKP